MHQKKCSPSVASQPNWLRWRKHVFSKIFFLNAIADIEQVQNEKKSFTFRCMLRQMTLEDSGEGQQWHRSMWNAWII
jgi:hypothetical protein